MIGKRPNSYKWHIPSKNTRLSVCCVGTPCAMCTVAFRFRPRKQANISIEHNLVGRPLESCPQQVIKTCSKCYQKIGRGIRHDCLSSTTIENTRVRLGKRNLITRFVADYVEKRLGDCVEANLDLPRPKGGRPLHITTSSFYHSSANVTSIGFDLEDLLKIKTIGGLSNRSLKLIIHLLKSKDFSIPGIKQFYIARDQWVGQYTEVVEMDLDTSSEKRTANIHPVWTLTVTDIAGLLNSAYSRTGDIEIYQIRYKLGLDFGQDFLKVTIQPEYSNSIKDLFIIWLSLVPEKYHNFQAVFTFHEFRRLLSDFKE